MANIGRGQLTLTDLNDAIVSGVEPTSPHTGQLWVDESATPNLIKRWNGTTWDIIGELLDSGTGQIIEDIQETLGNMSNDNIIDYNERQVIKDKLTEILGYVIIDSATSLPTMATLDAGTSGKGDVYNVRKNAVMVGISASDVKYTTVATKYNALKAYLDAMTPIKPWNLSTINQGDIINVTKSDFRTKWAEYYTAIADLATYTVQKAKEDVDGITVGGTNYASNGDFAFDITKSLWKDFYTGQTKEIVDISTETPPHKYALHVNNTTNAIGGIYVPTLWEGLVAEQMLNKEITISFWLKYQNIVQGANSWNKGRFGELVVEGETSGGTKVYTYNRISNINTVADYYFSGTDMTWKKYYGTHKITLPSTAVKITKIQFKHALDNCVGELWTTGIKIEFGNRVTDFSMSPLDLQQKFTDIEFGIQGDQIISKITSEESYIAEINTALGVDILVTKMNNVEQQITSDAITSSVTSNQQFSSLMDSKVDEEALGGYADRSEVEGMISNIDVSGEVDDRILEQSQDENSTLNKIYATQSQLKQEASNITAKFSATGGMNLIKNSVGYADFVTEVGKVGWYRGGIINRVSRISNIDLDVLGFGSGFKFTPSIATDDAEIYQDIPVVAGQMYTMSFYVNKVNNSVSDGKLYIQLQEKVSTTWTTKIEHIYQDGVVTTGYEPRTINKIFVNGIEEPFKASTNLMRVRIYADGLTDATVTGMMLTIGDVALQWSLATGESYNTNVRLDINGIRVSQLDSSRNEIGYTQITPSEFAGYWKTGSSFEKIFYLNGDETVTKKLRAKNEITMGTIKIIKVPINDESSQYVGWAFVPTTVVID